VLPQLLTEGCIIAVDVVADLVVVPPHEGASASEVICQAHQVVDPGLGAHGAVVAAVLQVGSNSFVYPWAPCLLRGITPFPNLSPLPAVTRAWLVSFKLLASTSHRLLPQTQGAGAAQITETCLRTS
jgi:hypothetical protein